jgi:hypothetical protein
MASTISGGTVSTQPTSDPQRASAQTHRNDEATDGILARISQTPGCYFRLATVLPLPILASAVSISWETASAFCCMAFAFVSAPR